MMAKDWTQEKAIEILEAERERLRAALKEIADFHTWEDISNEECMRDIARAALDGQPAPSGWRPIETAPKGAEPILLGNDEGFIEVGDWWVNTWAGGIGLNGPAFGIFTPIPLSFRPTHWMPLPPAPGKEGA